MIDADKGHKNTRIVNNIFVQDRRKALAYVPEKSDELEFSHNLWFGVPFARNLRGEGDVYEDPQFVDPESNKPAGFLLKRTSPARGAGLALDGKEAPALGAEFGPR